ncbi:MAG: PAS domain S-box protein [Rhodoferax sp.]
MGLLAKLIPATFRRWLITSLGGHDDDRFAKVFYTSPDWIVITRLGDGLVVDANHGFEIISGYSAKEVVGHSISDFNVWAVPEQRAQLVDELMSSGSVRGRLTQLRRRDGTHGECIVNAIQIALEGRTHSHAVWIVRDVTEQNAVHEQFKAAFQLTPDCMTISRVSDGTYVEVNQAYERVSGLTRAQTLGKTATQLGIWADLVERDALMSQIKQHGVANEFFVHIHTSSDQILAASVTAAIFEARGEQFLIALLRDVTETRKAADALRESEARFAKLFDQSPMPMGYSSSADDFSSTQWNGAWFSTFGFDPDTVQGKSGLELGFWVDGNERAKWLGRAVLGEQTSNAEIQVRRSDGALRWVAVSSRSFIEPTRTLVLFTYFDITERRHAQEEILTLNIDLETRVAMRTQALENANQELTETLETLKAAKNQLVQSEKLAALGALVAGVAHELNTPIGNGLTVATSIDYRITEFSHLMETGMKRSDLQAFLADTRQAADILSRNLMRAATLVSSFKQVAVDQTSSQRRTFVLKTLVSELLLTLDPGLRKTACKVNNATNDDVAMDSFPGPLGQVLTNLINNAVVHGYGEEQAGTVTISTPQINEDQIVIQVQDTGKGIDETHLAHVFEPFFTTRMGHGGSGLGLHIVHNLVTGVLGGTISVQSQPGQGATFSVTIPRHAPERTPALKPDAP